MWLSISFVMLAHLSWEQQVNILLMSDFAYIINHYYVLINVLSGGTFICLSYLSCVVFPML